MKWIFIDPCINNYIVNFKGFNADKVSDINNKKIELSLLLIGYIVKVYLNEN
jgi:hypothetical protein